VHPRGKSAPPRRARTGILSGRGSGVTRGRGDRPGVTPSRGDTRMKKICGQIYKEQWRNEIGQVKKVRGDRTGKRCGVTPSRGVTP